MGSKGSQTTTQNTNQTYEANPLVYGAGAQAISQAQGAASQPFQMPVAPVAGLTGDQNSAFQYYRNLASNAQPYMTQAANAYDASRTPITAADVNQYYNPMVDSVTANLKDIFGQQNQQNQGRLTAQAGGVGADRIAVGMANLAKEQGLSAGQTYSNLYQQALQQAQNQKNMQAGAGAGFASLGNQAFQSVGALQNAGGIQQQQAQAELNAPYQNTLARLAYPFQTAQYLAGITGGLAPAFGGTTTGQQTTTKPAPSLLSQLLGAGTAAAGLYGSFGGFGGSGGVGNYGQVANATGLGAGTGGLSFPMFAEGGATDEEEPQTYPGIGDSKGLMPIPVMNMQPGAGHSTPLTGGINFQQPQEDKGNSGGGLGDIVSAAAKIVPFFLKDGGVAKYADGGWDQDDRFNAAFVGRDPVPMPTPRPTPQLSFNERYAPAKELPAMKGPFEINQNLPKHDQAMDAYRMASTTPVRTLGKTFGDDELPEEAAPTVGNRNSKPNDPVKEYMAPQDQMPYPGATDRNWGQSFARSPWMSLVHAGAAMMSTPGTLGESIGAGLKAAVKSVDDQRKELRSEEEINNKARSLYQSAKQHLDQYTKMTPYQREAVRLRNKEIDQEGDKVGAKPDFKPAEIQAAIKAVKDDPMNIGKSQDELRALVAKELAMRKALRGTAGDTAPAAPGGGADGSSSGTALPDPGAGGRVKGKWYIGPTGQPQQWLG